MRTTPPRRGHEEPRPPLPSPRLGHSDPWRQNVYPPASRTQDGERAGGRQVLAFGRDHVSGAGPVPRGRGGAGRRSRPSGRSGLRALAGGGPGGCCCAPGLLGPDRTRSGAMSVDKAELCGSLLTWVGLGGGAGSGVCPLFLPCRGLLSSVWVLEGGIGRRLAGPLDSDLTTCPCHVGRPERQEQVRPRPSGAQAWSRVS